MKLILCMVAAAAFLLSACGQAMAQCPDGSRGLGSRLRQGFVGVRLAQAIGQARTGVESRPLLSRLTNARRAEPVRYATSAPHQSACQFSTPAATAVAYAAPAEYHPFTQPVANRIEQVQSIYPDDTRHLVVTSVPKQKKKICINGQCFEVDE